MGGMFFFTLSLHAEYGVWFVGYTRTPVSSVRILLYGYTDSIIVGSVYTL